MNIQPSPVALARVNTPVAEDGTGKDPKEAARMFEGMLWTQVFQAMRKTVEPSGLFGGEGESRSTYEYLLDQAVVTATMEKRGGFGLADRLEQQMTAQRTDKLKPEAS